MAANTVEYTIKLKDQASAAHKKIFDDIQQRNRQISESFREQGRKLWEDTRTPLEKYRMELAKIERLHKAGAIGMDTFVRANKKAADEFRKNASSMSSVWESLPFVDGMSGTAAIGLAAGAAVTAGLSLGSGYEDSVFQMSKTFQGESDKMIAKARELSESVKHYYDFTEVSYSMTKTADSMERYGITGDRYMSLVTRAMDIGAAKGIELRDAIDRVESAMRGEAEASEYLGITLHDTYMKNMSLNGTLKDQWEKLSDNEKAYYRWMELMQQSEKYLGAARDKTETLSGSLKSLAGTVKDYLGSAFASLGTSLASAINEITTAIGRSQDLRTTMLEARRESLLAESKRLAQGPGLFVANWKVPGTGWLGSADLNRERMQQIRAEVEAINAEIDRAYQHRSDGMVRKSTPKPADDKEYWDRLGKGYEEETKSALVKYREELELLEEVHRRGAVSEEAYLEKKRRLKEELDKATGAAKEHAKGLKKTEQQYSTLEAEATRLKESMRTPAEIFNAEVRNYDAMLSAKLLSTEQYTKAVEELWKKQFKAISLKELEDMQLTRTAKARDETYGTPVGGDAGIRAGGSLNESSSRSFQAHQEALQNTQSAYDSLKQAIEGFGQESAAAIADFCMGSETNFTDMINSMIRDVLRMMSYQYITQPFFSYISGLFGGSSSTSSVLPISAVAGQYHAGGIVGRTNAPTRQLPSSLLAYAPRLHSGLAADEFPAILQRGEQVIAKKDVGKTGASLNTVINVHLPAGGGGMDPATAKYVGSIVAAQVRAEFNKNLTEQLRPGGILNRRVG